jgi:hypothetical protein
MGVFACARAESFPPLDIGQCHNHLAIESTGTQQGRIEHVRTVGGRNQDHPLVRFETIHFHQQLVEGLLPFIVAAPKPAPRCRPTASISSIKIMQGAFFLPWTKRSRTREAPTPTNISTKSEPLMLKKGHPASPAMAGQQGFSCPGRPISSTPLGIRPPRRVNFLGSAETRQFQKAPLWPRRFRPRPRRSLWSVHPTAAVRDSFRMKAPCRLRICIWRMKKIHTPINTSIGNQETSTDMYHGFSRRFGLDGSPLSSSSNIDQIRILGSVNLETAAVGIGNVKFLPLNDDFRDATFIDHAQEIRCSSMLVSDIC